MPRLPTTCEYFVKLKTFNLIAADVNLNCQRKKKDFSADKCGFINIQTELLEGISKIPYSGISD